MMNIIGSIMMSVKTPVCCTHFLLPLTDHFMLFFTHEDKSTDTWDQPFLMERWLKIGQKFRKTQQVKNPCQNRVSKVLVQEVSKFQNRNAISPICTLKLFWYLFFSWKKKLLKIWENWNVNLLFSTNVMVQLHSNMVSLYLLYMFEKL